MLDESDDTGCGCREVSASRGAWRRSDEESCGCGDKPRDDSIGACPFPLELEPVREGPGFRVYELLPRTPFSWTNVIGSGRLTYDLTPYIPLDDVPEGLVVVRVHDNQMEQGHRAELVVELVALTEDQPELAFVANLPLASVVMNSATGEGKCLIARMRCDVGHYARVRLQLDQMPAPRGASMVLSADLVARTWDEDEEDEEGEECQCAHA